MIYCAECIFSELPDPIGGPTDNDLLCYRPGASRFLKFDFARIQRESNAPRDCGMKGIHFKLKQ